MSDPREDFFSTEEVPASRDDFFAAPPAPVVVAKTLPDGRPSTGWPGEAEMERTRNPTDDDTPIGAAIAHVVKGTAAGIVGGYRGLYDLATGKGAEHAASDVEATHDRMAYRPAGRAAEVTTKVLDSPWNPLNWPDVAGQKLGDASERLGLPPIVSTAARVAPDAIAAFYGMRRGSKAMQDEPAAPVEEPLYAKPGDVPVPETAGAPNAPFAEPAIAEAGSALDSAEQLRRTRVLHEIGLDELPHRQSAVTGDPLAAATDYELTKLDTEPGRFAKGLLDNERNALRNYAAQTVEKTGGIAGDTQSETIARGESVTGALESLSENYNKRIGDLYKAADQRAQGVPTELKSFQEILGDDSLMTNQDRLGLRSGLNAYLKKLKVVDENGNVTASIQQAETIRKYLNDEWSPQNSKLVSKLKNALDDDVTKDAGSDIYQSARQLRTERGATLDNPKGIARLIDSSGPNGINRTVSSDKVMQTLETMPPEQLEHVMTTLRGVKGELEPQAQDALSAIQSHFAQRLHNIGESQQTQWNSKGVNQFLKGNSARLNVVFADKPELLNRLYTLNEAGKLLRVPAGYPGAYAQAINLSKTGAVPSYLHRGIAMGGSAVGGWLGGPGGASLGAAAGDVAGARIAKGMANKAAMKAAQSRAVMPETPQP